MTDKTHADKLAESVNSMYNKQQTESLVRLVKLQAEEIDKRGQIIVTLEESTRLQKENIEKLVKQNRDLEILVESLRNERKNLIEELEFLKVQPVEAKTKTLRKKKTKEEETQAA